jgi:hypothetical protein
MHQSKYLDPIRVDMDVHPIYGSMIASTQIFVNLLAFPNKDMNLSQTSAPEGQVQ